MPGGSGPSSSGWRKSSSSRRRSHQPATQIAITPAAVRTSRGSASRPAMSTVAISATPATIQPAAAKLSLSLGGGPKKARMMHATRRAASPASNKGGRAVMLLWSPPRQVSRESRRRAARSGGPAVSAAPVDPDDGAGLGGQDEQAWTGGLAVDVERESEVVDHPAGPGVGQPIRHLGELGPAIGHDAEQVVERERVTGCGQRGEQQLAVVRPALVVAPVLERHPAHPGLCTALRPPDLCARRKCTTLRGRESVTLSAVVRWLRATSTASALSDGRMLQTRRATRMPWASTHSREGITRKRGCWTPGRTAA